MLELGSGLEEGVMARAVMSARWIFLAALAAFALWLPGCTNYMPEALQASPAPPGPNTDRVVDKSGAAPQERPKMNARFDSILDDILARQELRVGVSPGFVPFVASGKDAATVREKATGPLSDDPRDIVGLDIEIAKAIADSLEVKLVVVEKSGIAAVLNGLQDGTIDMAMSGLTRTLPRARNFFFSEPYFTSGVVVMVPKAAPYQRLADANVQRVRVLVKPNTTAQTFASRFLGNASTIAAKDERTLATLFDQGDKIAIVDQIKARNFQLAKTMQIEFRILENRRFTDEHFSIALPRDEAWRSYINIFIQDFKESGHLDELTQKFALWLK